MFFREAFSCTTVVVPQSGRIEERRTLLLKLLNNTADKSIESVKTRKSFGGSRRRVQDIRVSRRVG